MMVDDLSGDSCLGGVLGNRHGSTNICAAVRSMLGEKGGRTITAGLVGSSSRAILSLGVGAIMVWAVGVSETASKGSWKSTVSPCTKMLTRSRS